MDLPTFRDELRAAIEQDHPCTDDNACDIAKAVASGCELWGAHILQGATECPATDEVMERVCALFPDAAAFDAALEEDRVRLLENLHGTCPECNALVWLDDGEVETSCGNCRATVRVTLDDFTHAYLECALWISTDGSTPQGGEPLDKNYDVDDIAPDALKSAIDDCEAFQRDHADLLARAEYKISGEWSKEAQAGHDFWLTRNRHGAGFWDRGLGAVGRALTDAAHAYGSCDLYVGDDGKIYGF